MDETERSLVQEWLTIAYLDLDTARLLGKGPHTVYETAIYHCQQAVEKVVKGFLVFHGQRFTKTHNLLALTQLAEVVEPLFSTWHNNANELTPYAVEIRYPETFRHIDKQEFEAALLAATGLYTFVLSLLPPETYPKS